MKTKIDGFTPLFDILLRDPEIGLSGAAVYGRIWRYCQMESKRCFAALDTLASDLGLSRKTVQRQLALLTTNEYIKDLTPFRRNAPHDYICTDKVDLLIEIGETKSPTAEVGQNVQAVGQNVPPGESKCPTKVGQNVPQRNNTRNKKDSSKKPSADPLAFDLDRATATKKEEAWSDITTDVLADTAIDCLCNGKMPRRGSGTHRDMINVISPIHADYGLNDMPQGEALDVVRSAVGLFLKEKPGMAVYRYKSFSGDYGRYISLALNGDGNGGQQKGVRQDGPHQQVPGGNRRRTPEQWADPDPWHEG